MTNKLEYTDRNIDALYDSEQKHKKFVDRLNYLYEFGTDEQYESFSGGVPKSEHRTLLEAEEDSLRRFSTSAHGLDD